MLGNGGTTVFWDVATFGLVEQRSEHLVFGEFSAKFAEASAAAPHLDEPLVVACRSRRSSRAGRRRHGRRPTPSPTTRPPPAWRWTSSGRPAPTARIVVVDATSGAGGLPWDPADVDVYYFAPQKCFASDGGLWIAACSPAAIERIDRITAGGRWRPASLDLGIALANSRLDQTYNTPAVATLVLFDAQLRWMLDSGGLDWCVKRCRTSSDHLYALGRGPAWATPFVADPAKRSAVVGTIDLDDALDVTKLNAALRANGIVDTDGYRKLGRNQIRIGMFPAIETADVDALTACIDHLVEHHREALAP